MATSFSISSGVHPSQRFFTAPVGCPAVATATPADGCTAVVDGFTPEEAVRRFVLVVIVATAAPCAIIPKGGQKTFFRSGLNDRNDTVFYFIFSRAQLLVQLSQSGHSLRSSLAKRDSCVQQVDRRDKAVPADRVIGYSVATNDVKVEQVEEEEATALLS